MITLLKRAILTKADPEKEKILQRFFKTGKGEYAEGDRFIGVTVPAIRAIMKAHWKTTSLEDVSVLVQSRIHEERTLGLLILVEKFKKTKHVAERECLIQFYLQPQHLKHINNWDLVDVSCYHLLGQHLFEHPQHTPLLYEFSQSDNLWIRRIAIISTFAFIKQGQFEHTIQIAQALLQDKHDLIHKAVGWMLREMGKRNLSLLRIFLNQHAHIMPRTMLRYAIEKLDEQERTFYKGMATQ
jgi:3-methyladenine DNA glycosylase AlkD